MPRLSATIILFLLFPFISQGAFSDIIINEICWMGTKNSANDEWIELYNNAQAAQNLNGWILKANDGTPEIKLSGEIPSNGFFLLERTDDNTLPNIPADLIYKGALGNNGEDLKLYDDSGNLADEINCRDSWPAGDNKTKQTMERIGVRPGSDPGLTPSWQNSAKPNGTPNLPNPPPISPTSPTPSPNTPTISSTTFPALQLSELLPSPEGSDSDNEWIEIFNQNDFEVELSQWKIKDTEGKTTTYAFPDGFKIPAKSYLVFSRTQTKITLNNDKDGLELVQPNGEIIDSTVYQKAPNNQSCNRIKDEWFWSSDLTPGEANIISQNSQTYTNNLNSPNALNSSNDQISLNAPTPLTASLSATASPITLLLIAFVLAISSGIVFLILKKNIS